MGSGRLCAKTSCLTHFCPEILRQIVLPHGCIKKPDLICRIEKASIVVFRFLPKDTASWISFCQVVLEASHGTTAGDFRATPSIQIDPCLRCHWLVRNDFSSFSRLRRGTSARLLLFWAEGPWVSSRVGFHDFSFHLFSYVDTASFWFSKFTWLLVTWVKTLFFDS